MPHVVRLGCAGIAVLAIAILTSIGLYAVVVGGVVFGAPATRATSAPVPVLVTIQTLPVTPTIVPIPTATPMPASLIPGLSQPAAPPLALPASPLPSPPVTASPRAESTPTAVHATPGRTAVHDGLTLDIVEVERGWQARAPEGSPANSRDGYEHMAVHVRLTNGTSELRYVADQDLVLVADDGARLSPRQTSPLHDPRLLTLPIPPGDTVRGWLTYEIASDSAPRRVQWNPTRPDRPRAEATYLLTLP